MITKEIINEKTLNLIEEVASIIWESNGEKLEKELAYINGVCELGRILKEEIEKC